jgi:uncharacterized membrane protein YozB (DUF420 family)
MCMPCSALSLAHWQVYIVFRMKFDLPEKFAIKRVKRLMRTAFTLWWLTLVLGVSFYVWYYVL